MPRDELMARWMRHERVLALARELPHTDGAVQDAIIDAIGAQLSHGAPS